MVHTFRSAGSPNLLGGQEHWRVHLVSVERQTKKDKDRQAEDSEGHKEHGGGRVKGMKKMENRSWMARDKTTNASCPGIRDLASFQKQK